MNGKLEKVIRCEDTISVVKKYERLMKSQKQNIIYLRYKEVLIFSKFKESEKFQKMVKNLGISNSSINLKINLFKLVVKYPKLKNLSLHMIYFKRHFKPSKVICKTSGSNFKPAEAI